MLIVVSSFSLIQAETFGYGRTEDIAINYSELPTVNSSKYWNTITLGPLDDANSAQFDNIGGTLTIDESHLELIGNAWWLRLDGTNSPTSNINWDGHNILMSYGNITDIGALDFNINGCDGETHDAGHLCYDYDADTLSLTTQTGQTIQIGREVSERGINRNGNLLNGAVVYLSGASGDNPEFKAADGSNVSESGMVGILTTDCLADNICPITVFGFVNDIDTTAWAVTDKLYLNASSPGELTNVIPTLPNNPVWVATVVRSHATQGRIFVNPLIDPADGFLIDSIWATGNVTANWINANHFNFTTDTWFDFVNNNNLTFNQSKLTTTYYNASSIQVVTGTGSGDLADIQTYNQVTYNVTEDASDFELRVNFTNITEFTTLLVRHKSSDNENHISAIQIWDYDSSSWEGYGYLTESTTSEMKTLGVYDDSEHIGTGADLGVVQVRFYQNEEPPPKTHIHEFDWVALSKGFGTPVGQEIDPIFSQWLSNPVFIENVNGSLVNSTWDYITVDTLTVGNANITGNISAGYFIGDGSQLTNLPETDLTGYAKYQFENNNFNGSGNFTTTGEGIFGNIDITDEVSGYQIDNVRILTNAGTENIIAGEGAGSNTLGEDNTFYGYHAGFWNDDSGAGLGDSNTYIGHGAGKGSSGATQNAGSANVAVGSSALGKNSLGFRNVALGVSASQDNTEGNDNIGIGYGALEDVNTGDENIGIGTYAGNGLTTGTGNIFIGSYAGYNVAGVSDRLLIDNQMRDAYFNESLIYGVFDSDPANQSLTFNANVGIGTTNPTHELNVVGDLNVTGLIYGNGSQLTDLPETNLTGYAKYQFTNNNFNGSGNISLGQVLNIGLNDATNPTINFLGSTNDGAITYDESANEFDLGSGNFTTTGEINASKFYSNTASATGTDAIAFGFNTTASGDGSFSVGDTTDASGDYSFASGLNSNASGLYGAAMGWNALASGIASTAFGNGQATGTYTTAMGLHAAASQPYSTSIGRDTTSSGLGSVAMGDSVTASGSASIAMGYDVKSGGAGSVATGFSSGLTIMYAGTANLEANGYGSHASGSVVARGFDAIADGEILANGSGSRAHGYINTRGGILAIRAIGDGSVAMGYSTGTIQAGEVGTDYGALALGYNVQALGVANIALGQGVITNTGNNVIGIGKNFNNSVDSSFAVGFSRPNLFVSNADAYVNVTNSFIVYNDTGYGTIEYGSAIDHTPTFSSIDFYDKLNSFDNILNINNKVNRFDEEVVITSRIDYSRPVNIPYDYTYCKIDTSLDNRAEKEICKTIELYNVTYPYTIEVEGRDMGISIDTNRILISNLKQENDMLKSFQQDICTEDNAKYNKYDWCDL